MKNLIILFIMMGLMTSSFAQPSGTNGKKEHREKIREWKTAFITDKLDLSEEESIRFWPIYNEREKALRALSKEKKSLRLNEIDQMSEAEAEATIDKHFEMRQRELDIHRESFNKLKKVIPAKKLARLPRVEREFKKVILQKMRGQGGEGRPGPGGRERNRTSGPH